MENPVLELVKKDPSQLSEKAAERQRKLEWLESADNQNKIYYRNDHSDEYSNENLHDIMDSGESLAEYLLSQLICLPYSKEEMRILKYLIYSLDSKGYYTEDASIPAR